MSICQLISKNPAPNESIKQAAPEIFDFDFPFYDETKRQEFEENFLRYFYMREIGSETYGLFKLRLQSKLQTVMPYYNKMYSAAEQTIEPFITEKIDETIEREHKNTNISTGTDTATSNSTVKGKNNVIVDGTSDSNEQNSDLPQSDLASFEDNSYLSGASKGHSTNHGTTDTTSENTAIGTGTTNRTNNENRTGNETEKRTANNFRGVPGDILKSYYDSIRNINQEFYNDCEDLFISLWV